MSEPHIYYRGIDDAIVTGLLDTEVLQLGYTEEQVELEFDDYFDD